MAGGMQGGYGGMPSAPVRRSGGSNCLVIGLVGCGIVAVLGVGLVLYGAYQFSHNKNFQNLAHGIECTSNLATLREALDGYQKDHDGKYPPTLSALEPKYVPDDSALDCKSGETTIKFDYTPPKPDAAPDTPVVSFRSGDFNMNFGQKQQVSIYTRLLKNGHIVRDQVTRTDVSDKSEGKTNP